MTGNSVSSLVRVYYEVIGEHEGELNLFEFEHYNEIVQIVDIVQAMYPSNKSSLKQNEINGFYVPCVFQIKNFEPSRQKTFIDVWNPASVVPLNEKQEIFCKILMLDRPKYFTHSEIVSEQQENYRRASEWGEINRSKERYDPKEQDQRYQDRSDRQRSQIELSLSSTAKTLYSFVESAVKQMSEQFTNSELTIGRHQVSLIKQIAEGGFAQVYLCKDPQTDVEYALKRMICQSNELYQTASKEIQNLKALQHRNIIEIVGNSTSQHPENPNWRLVDMLFPFYHGGTVWDKISNWTAGMPWEFPEERIITIGLAVCDALEHMHSKGYAHWDLKPMNILLANDGSPVLMDLGSARNPCRIPIRNRKHALTIEDEASVNCSLPYRAPELTQVEVDTIIDERVDVWSLGCTIYAMAFGWSPFEDSREGVKKLAIVNGRFSFPVGRRYADCTYGQQFCNAISSILIVNPTKRPFIQQVNQILQTSQRN